jgi:hypothetical protein
VADFLGSVPIPDPPVIAPFPLVGDFGGGIDYEPQVVTHVFDREADPGRGLRVEQRFLMGNGVRRFRFVRDHLSCGEYDALRNHWMAAQGVYAQFSATIRKPGASETVTARYENPNLQFNHLIAFIASTSGLSLMEVPTVTPTYAVTATVERFPDATLTPALESQVQRFTPLIAIQPRGSADILRLSNQRCIVGGNLYLPRLLDWTGIGQAISETSDNAQFTLGNADDVFVSYANATNLYRARIEFGLYHHNTGYLIKLWAGYARPWTLTSDGVFVLPASDGLFELSLGYPWRQVSRTCWKVYKGPYCPSVSALATCPKDYKACVERGVEKSFGGIQAQAQTVRITPFAAAFAAMGYGRSRFTSVTVANESIYQRPVQEVYTDFPMKVVCDVAAGRDESEFYSALGVVGEGPIGSFATNLVAHQLDNQPPHDPKHNGGWRGITGTDPAAPSDFFALDKAPWGSIPAESTYAAGVAFAEIRRTDEVGLQLAAVADRAMTVTVNQGIGGWVWDTGVRVWQNGLSNPVWVAVNVYLRGIGLRVDQTRAAVVSAVEMERFFDVAAARAAAAVCDGIVNSMIVAGVTEKRFVFRGVLKEKKPLKDWIQEILNCCSGYYTFLNGKLWIGIRKDSAVLAGNAFTRANILYKSLQASPVTPRFNWLVGQFGDEEFEWALNTVTIYDIDHAEWLGDADGVPQYLTNQMTFVGCSSKSQCARLITTRLREELGGLWSNSTSVNEQIRARDLKFRTTILALRTMVGDIISLDHDRLPAGRGEGRVQSWQLNPDYSIDINATCTTDSMYEPAFGPSPADVAATPPPPDRLQSINGLAWMPNLVAPFANDPLYPDVRERTFDLWQDYNITREGIWSPAVWVAGEECVNQFASPARPRILGVELAAGGQINGPCTVYVAITQRDATGAPSAVSNLYARYVPSGSVNQKLTITMAPAPTGTWVGYDVYIGTDRRKIALQISPAGVPTSLEFTSTIAQMTRQLPEPAAQRVRIAAKHVWHSGIAGVIVTSPTSLAAPNKLQCNDYIGSTDNWIGRVLSAVADLSDGGAPLWNFTVTAFVPATGTFTVTPNCVRADPADSVDEGDVLIMRSVGVSSGVDWVEDPLWDNTINDLQFPGTNGLRVDEEAGRLVRILRGKGAGQVRKIVSNTNVRVYVEPPWEVQPDATSIVIIEAHDWDYAGVTSELITPRPGTAFELRVRVDNLANMVALVGGFLVDDQERITDEEFAVYREIFIYGQPPSVRVVGPTALDPATAAPWEVFATDHTIRADTSTNHVQVQLMALGAYQGRTLYFCNDNGPNNLIVNCAAGELLFDGNANVIVAPEETVRVTAG